MCWFRPMNRGRKSTQYLPGCASDILQAKTKRAGDASTLSSTFSSASAWLLSLSDLYSYLEAHSNLFVPLKGKRLSKRDTSESVVAATFRAPTVVEANRLQTADDSMSELVVPTNDHNNGASGSKLPQMNTKSPSVRSFAENVDVCADAEGADQEIIGEATHVVQFATEMTRPEEVDPSFAVPVVTKTETTNLITSPDVDEPLIVGDATAIIALPSNKQVAIPEREVSKLSISSESKK